METDDNPSDKPFSDSEDDLGEALVDSDKAGQEAPMTGPTSAAPFEGLFHADRLPTLPFGPEPLSELSTPVSSTSEGEEEADGGGDDDEDEGPPEPPPAAMMACSATTDEGDEGTVAIGSSRRTVLFQGEAPALEGRRDWGLLTPSPAWRGDFRAAVVVVVVAGAAPTEELLFIAAIEDTQKKRNTVRVRANESVDDELIDAEKGKIGIKMIKFF